MQVAESLRQTTATILSALWSGGMKDVHWVMRQGDSVKGHDIIFTTEFFCVCLFPCCILAAFYLVHNFLKQYVLWGE